MIHDQYPEIPINTIKTTVTREAKRHQNETSPRSGRPSLLDEDDQKRLNDAIRANPNITYGDLLKVVDYKVKKEAIRRLLVKEGRRK